MKPGGISSTWWVTSAMAAGRGWAASSDEQHEEALAAAEVEAGGGLVQQEQVGVGHERAGDEDAAALALGEGADGAVGERGHAHAPEQVPGALEVGVGVDVAPRGQGGVAGHRDRFQARAGRAQQPLQRRARVADARAQVADVDPADGLAEDRHAATGRELVGAGDLQQRGLAGAVRPEDDPALPRLHLPGHVTQQHVAVADDRDRLDGEDRDHPAQTGRVSRAAAKSSTASVMSKASSGFTTEPGQRRELAVGVLDQPRHRREARLGAALERDRRPAPLGAGDARVRGEDLAQGLQAGLAAALPERGQRPAQVPRRREPLQHVRAHRAAGEGLQRDVLERHGSQLVQHRAACGLVAVQPRLLGLLAGDLQREELAGGHERDVERRIAVAVGGLRSLDRLAPDGVQQQVGRGVVGDADHELRGLAQRHGGAHLAVHQHAAAQAEVGLRERQLLVPGQ